MTRKDIGNIETGKLICEITASRKPPNASKNASRNNEAEGVESRARADRK